MGSPAAAPAALPFGRRERHKQDVRRRLLEAARECFHREGFERTCVKDITERADVGYGTFFNYFPSKDAVLAEMAEEHLQELRTVVAGTQGKSFPERLSIILSAWGSGFEQEPAFARNLIVDIVRRTVSPEHKLSPAREKRLSLLAGLVEEAQAAGELRADLDVAFLAETILGLFLMQLCVRLGDPEGPSLEERASRAMSLLWEGISAGR